jgi:hypothetical protein
MKISISGIFIVFPFKKSGILFLPYSTFPASFSKIGARKVAVSLNGIKKIRVGGKGRWGRQERLG